MRIKLQTSDGIEVPFDTRLGGFRCSGPMPCILCGECCSRYQAPVDIEEATRIAARLGIELDSFLAECTQPYPMRLNEYLIRQKNGGCLFLRREGSRALCSIHEFKPQACTSWTASLEQNACREGIKNLGGPGGLLKPEELNLSGEELKVFCELLKASGIGHN